MIDNEPCGQLLIIHFSFIHFLWLALNAGAVAQSSGNGRNDTHGDLQHQFPGFSFQSWELVVFSDSLCQP